MEEAQVRQGFRAITEALIRTGQTITTMESCTGGYLASLLTDTEGASATIPGAYVTYSNAAKVRAGVPRDVIEFYGVYSPETAKSMAECCREAFQTDFGIGVTGSFGNKDPANGDSVPGEIWIAAATGSGTEVRELYCTPQESRHAYKVQVAEAAAALLQEVMHSYAKTEGRYSS